jgi:hypothetical protein
MQTNGSHEFPEFFKQKFRNLGTWGKKEFPEIGISENAITTRRHYSIL